MQTTGRVTTMNIISKDLNRWLTHYIEKKDCLHKSLAVSLQKKLETIHSLDQLGDLIESIKIPTSRKAFFGQETPDPLVSKLNAVNQTIQQIKLLHSKQIHLQFIRLSATKKTQCVLALLEHVLTQPHALFHMQILNLLRQVSDLSQLQYILNHLEKQPYISPPIFAQPGTFDSVKQLSLEHKECLDLLRSNAATFKHGHAHVHGIGANILLQTVLKIYQDCHIPISFELFTDEPHIHRPAMTV